jgi:Zn-dependent protease with chaperone function
MRACIFLGWTLSKTNFLVFTKGLHSLVFTFYFTTGLHPLVLAWKFDFFVSMYMILEIHKLIILAMLSRNETASSPPQVPPKDVVQAEKKRVQRSAAPALRSASPAPRQDAVQAEKERVQRSAEPAQRSASPVPRVPPSTAQPNKPPTPRSPTPKCLHTEYNPDASDLE